MVRIQSEGDGGLGRAIQLRRVELGLKRRDLALRAELSYPYVSEIENGQKEPSAKALRQLAGALDWTPSELISVADRVVGDEPSSMLLDEPSPSPPLRAPSAERAGTWTAAPLLASQAGGPMDDVMSAWLTELLARVVRAELARWAERELPAIIRKELDRARRTGSSA